MTAGCSAAGASHLLCRGDIGAEQDDDRRVRFVFRPRQDGRFQHLCQYVKGVVVSRTFSLPRGGLDRAMAVRGYPVDDREDRAAHCRRAERWKGTHAMIAPVGHPATPMPPAQVSQASGSRRVGGDTDGDSDQGAEAGERAARPAPSGAPGLGARIDVRV